MQMFYPVSLEEGLKILRVKLRHDVVKTRLDGNQCLSCYTSRAAAVRKAREAIESGRSKQEMFLLVMDVDCPCILADLRRERPVDRVPLASYKGGNGEKIALTMQAQDIISRQACFSIEIVSGTEDIYAETYQNGAPNWNAGSVGPRK